MVAPVPAHISKPRPRLCTPPGRRFPAHSRPSDAPSGASKGAHFAKGCKSAETATLTTFRINTCKSVSKQSPLTTFRMNTYEKQGEGGTPADRRLTLTGVPISSAHHMRHVTSLSPVPSLACAYFLSPRGCAPHALQISASDLVADGDRFPAIPFFHFARRLGIPATAFLG